MKKILEFLKSSKLSFIGALILVLILLIAIFAPFLAPNNPYATDSFNRLDNPSSEFYFGTDASGRDIFSRVIYGFRVSAWVGFSLLIITTVLGFIIGAVCVLFPILDNFIMRIMDGFMALPGLLIAISIMAALGPRTINVVIALSIPYTPRTVRVARGAMISLREKEFVIAAEAMGANKIRILLRHYLPNALPPIIVQATFTMAMAILAEASLSFIGAGTPPPIPSLGNILADGRRHMWAAPWISIFPGVSIVFMVLATNLIGDGLRDYLDPKTIER